jgi:hypothetical protein
MDTIPTTLLEPRTTNGDGIKIEILTNNDFNVIVYDNYKIDKKFKIYNKSSTSSKAILILDNYTRSDYLTMAFSFSLGSLITLLAIKIQRAGTNKFSTRHNK